MNFDKITLVSLAMMVLLSLVFEDHTAKEPAGVAAPAPKQGNKLSEDNIEAISENVKIGMTEPEVERNLGGKGVEDKSIPDLPISYHVKMWGLRGNLDKKNGSRIFVHFKDGTVTFVQLQKTNPPGYILPRPPPPPLPKAPPPLPGKEISIL